MKKLLSFAAVLFASVMLLTSCGSAIDGVKQVAELTNQMCPMDQGNGVVINSVALNGDQLVYTCEADEDYIDLNSNAEAVRNEMVASLKSDADVVNMFKSAKVTIVYKFVGSQSGETVQFTITPDEL